LGFDSGLEATGFFSEIANKPGVSPPNDVGLWIGSGGGPNENIGVVAGSFNFGDFSTVLLLEPRSGICFGGGLPAILLFAGESGERRAGDFTGDCSGDLIGGLLGDFIGDLNLNSLVGTPLDLVIGFSPSAVEPEITFEAISL
jgi:hypothetical protein